MDANPTCGQVPKVSLTTNRHFSDTRNNNASRAWTSRENKDCLIVPTTNSKRNRLMSSLEREFFLVPVFHDNRYVIKILIPRYTFKLTIFISFAQWDTFLHTKLPYEVGPPEYPATDDTLQSSGGQSDNLFYSLIPPTHHVCKVCVHPRRPRFPSTHSSTRPC